MKRIPLYIDTDMGVDDIVALCMIVASNKFDIRGISVVNGVSSIKAGVNNLNKILTFLGISCPIFLGAGQKEQGSIIQFPALDRTRAKKLALITDVILPNAGTNPVLPLALLNQQIQAEKKPVTLFAIGPLTNVPKLLSSNNIASITIMGGTVRAKGIVPPAYITEYNIHLDPVSANTVFDTKIPIILIPLDATQWVPTKLEDTEGAIYRMLKNFYISIKTYKPTTNSGCIIKNIILNNQRDFSQFYDPLAAAILIDPTIATMSLSSQLNVTSQGKIISVKKEIGPTTVYQVNSQRFYELLVKLIE